MKLIFGIFSTLALLVASFTVTETAFGLGPSVSGGVPPAPRAVVIQAHAVKRAFDEDGLQIALALAGQHVAANRILAFTQRDEAQNNDRKYICVEYRDFADYVTATQEFQTALANNPSIEVVSNSFCR
jgi:hypothetical protein